MSSAVSYVNYADQAVLSTTIDHDIVTPLSRLQARPLAEPCILYGNTYDVRADLLAPRKIGIVSLLGMFGQFIVSTATNQLIVSGGVQISSNSTFTSILWESGWGAGDNYIEYPPFHDPLNLHVLPPDIVGRYVRAFAFEPLPATIQRGAGRLWIGPALRCEQDAGWALTGYDGGSIDRSSGGQYVEGPGPRSRIVTTSFTDIDSVQAIGIDETDNATPARDVPCFDGLRRVAGATGEVIVLPRTGNAIWINRLGLYGHLTRPPQINHINGPSYSAALTVEEER